MQVEALKLALDALEYLATQIKPDYEHSKAITAIKAALEAKDEPVKLRRGDILRCNESDELCTVWATSTSGKMLVKWKDNDFGNYTAEQIGELFWIEPKEKDEPDYKALWQQMCERCDELDKKLAQRKPLTDEEIERIYNRYGGEMINCARAIERAHGIKGEA